MNNADDELDKRIGDWRHAVRVAKERGEPPPSSHGGFVNAVIARDRRRGEEIAAWLLLVGVDILGLDGPPDAGEDEGLGISPVGRQLTFVSAALRSYKRRAEERGEQIERLRAVPYEHGPDGEPGPPDLGAYVDACKERDAAKAAAERLRDALRELVREADAHLLPYDTAGGKAESGKALYVTSVKAIAEAALAADAAAGGDPPHEPREEA